MTSANVVGYANNTNINLSGGSIASAMFKTVGSTTETIKFGDLVPLMADGTMAKSGKVIIQYLTPGGATDDTKKYQWFGTYWRNSATKSDAKDEEIIAGQGLWVINNTSAKLTLRSAGEVSEAEVVFKMSPSGGICAGNTFPVDITFGQIVPKDGSGVAAKSGKVIIQYLTAGGATDDTKKYQWFGTYWRNSATKSDAKDEKIPAGKGMWVINNTSADCWLHIAAPEF